MAQYAQTLADYTASGRTYRDTGLKILGAKDSDGCVDDGMTVKQWGNDIDKAAPFPAAAIEVFRLQPVAAAYRIASAYVNLVKDRGGPRFRCLAGAMEQVATMDALRESIILPELPYFREYVRKVRDGELSGWGDNVLLDYIDSLSPGQERTELLLIAQWSQTVNRNVERDVSYLPPFQVATETIRREHDEGIDILIVSGTPETHLRTTWEEHGMLDIVRGVFGRESKKKKDHLVAAMKQGGYDRAIMFGDAQGDNKGRKEANEALGENLIRFYPIRAGLEEQDWQWFNDTFVEPGRVHEYDAAAEAEAIARFEANLKRPWKPKLSEIRPDMKLFEMFPLE